MNIYDKAHDLARMLQQSQEHQSFLVEQKKVQSDNQAKKMVKEFITKKIELEYETMAGKPEDKAKMEQLQRMYEVLCVNANARDFLHAQMRFQQLMGDVYKILGDSVAEGLDFLAKD
jgi:cell fate (sporulation/competence/biofilm development) regulator YlbF (YheA/YmcA/DUF963 family)